MEMSFLIIHMFDFSMILHLCIKIQFIIEMHIILYNFVLELFKIIHFNAKQLEILK